MLSLDHMKKIYQNDDITSDQVTEASIKSVMSWYMRFLHEFFASPPDEQEVLLKIGDEDERYSVEEVKKDVHALMAVLPREEDSWYLRGKLTAKLHYPINLCSYTRMAMAKAIYQEKSVLCGSLTAKDQKAHEL